MKSTKTPEPVKAVIEKMTKGKLPTTTIVKAVKPQQPAASTAKSSLESLDGNCRLDPFSFHFATMEIAMHDCHSLHYSIKACTLFGQSSQCEQFPFAQNFFQSHMPVD